MTARFALAVLLVMLVILIEPDVVQAQCAMCVTALEQNGGELAAGFNRGILFLLGMPYFVFTAIGTSWYVKRKRRQNALPVN